MTAHDYESIARENELLRDEILRLKKTTTHYRKVLEAIATQSVWNAVEASKFALEFAPSGVKP